MPKFEILLENLMATSAANAVAGSEASTSTADDNLENEEPSRFWRSTSLEPQKNWYYQGVGGVPVQADRLYIVGHNLYPGAAEYRVVLTGLQAISPALAIVVPDGVIASSNMTGAATDIDEGWTPDANWMTPTAAGSDWDVHLSFPSPGGGETPTPGARYQCFWAYVKAPTATTKVQFPTVRLELWEKGNITALGVVGTKAILSTTGQWLFWSWDAAEIGDFVDLQVKLFFSYVEGPLGSDTGQRAHLGAFHWQTYNAGNEFSSSAEYDTGWVPYTDTLVSGRTFSPEPLVAQQIIRVSFGSMVTFYRCYVLFRSDYTPLNTDLTGTIPFDTMLYPDPVPYVQVGCSPLGESFTAVIDCQPGDLVSFVSPDVKQYTDGSRQFGSRRRGRRVVRLNLAWLTPTEAHTLMDRLIARHGLLKPFAVSLIPGDATEGKNVTLFGSLRNPEMAMGFHGTRSAEYSRALSALEFEEVL